MKEIAFNYAFLLRELGHRVEAGLSLKHIGVDEVVSLEKQRLTQMHANA